MQFIESSSFTKVVYHYLSEEEYKKFQAKLVKRPRLGNAIPECGGIRKLRWAQGSKTQGKRSGLRIFYLYIERVSHIYLLAVLGKGERGDISAKEKKLLKHLATQLKNTARRHHEKENII